MSRFLPSSKPPPPTRFIGGGSAFTWSSFSGLGNEDVGCTTLLTGRVMDLRRGLGCPPDISWTGPSSGSSTEITLSSKVVRLKLDLEEGVLLWFTFPTLSSPCNLASLFLSSLCLVQCTYVLPDYLPVLTCDPHFLNSPQSPLPVRLPKTSVLVEVQSLKVSCFAALWMTCV